jgi:small GTP-binding protein
MANRRGVSRPQFRTVTSFREMCDRNEFSIAVLGAGGVGKTCLILRLTRDTFDRDHIPTIQDYFEKKMTVSGVPYNLKVIDTAGQDEMEGITDIGIADADAHMIVYSVTSQVSFNEANRYREKVKNLARHGDHLVLCGNKCDAPDRAITEKAGKDKADSWGCRFFETSARENINIAEAFEAVLRTLLPEESSPLPKDGKQKGIAGDDAICACTVA